MKSNYPALTILNEEIVIIKNTTNEKKNFISIGIH